MKKNTSILLGEYFDNFIVEEISTGRFSSASEVVRTALRLLELEELKSRNLKNELLKGEQSGFVEKFDKKSFLNSLHEKHISP